MILEIASRLERFAKSVVEVAAVEEMERHFPDLMEMTVRASQCQKLMRQYLELMVRFRDAELLDGIAGIKLIEPDRGQNISCFEYQFGKCDDPAKVWQEVEQTSKFSSEPHVGAYALYINAFFEPQHVGRVTPGLKVISKWGLQGPVYEHPPFMVPIIYGNLILYYSTPDWI